MKKIVLFSLIVLLAVPGFVFSQDEEEIDVDKEINAVMEKMVKRLEDIGLSELRDGLATNVEQLFYYHQAWKIAVQLDNKELLQEIEWFIEITEKNINFTLKTIQRLDMQLWSLKQKLRKLLKEKNRLIRKNRKKQEV